MCVRGIDFTFISLIFLMEFENFPLSCFANHFILAILKVAPILINIELLEQIATAQNNKKHLHLLYKEGLCVLLLPLFLQFVKWNLKIVRQSDIVCFSIYYKLTQSVRC
jgi:hypothetical protein